MSASPHSSYPHIAHTARHLAKPSAPLHSSDPPDSPGSSDPKDSTMIGIMKGPTVDKLEPSMLVPLSLSLDEKLSDLRKELQSLGYMKKSDLFLTPSKYTVSKSAEGGHLWKEALWPVGGDASGDNEPTDDPPEGPAEHSAYNVMTRSSGGTWERSLTGDTRLSQTIIKPKVELIRDDKDRTGSIEEYLANPGLAKLSSAEYPHISILSAERKTVQPPDLPGEHKYSPPPTTDVPKLPDAPDIDRVNTSNQSVVNAKMLNNGQLDELFDINSLLCGLLTETKPPSRAFQPIFEAPAEIHDFIQVFDKPHVESYTTSNAQHSSLLEQGYEEASLSVPTPWVGVSVSGSHSNSDNKTSDTSQTYTTAMYRFPRAICYLPPESLKPTEGFKMALDKVFTSASKSEMDDSIKGLFATYGHVIATKVILGGHLHMTKTEKTVKAMDSVTTEWSVRAALTSCIGVSASGGGGSKSASGSSTAQSDSDLALEAVGGDTLLVSNPKLWQSSVMPYTNWRVTKFMDLKPLYEFHHLFPSEYHRQVFRDYFSGRDDTNRIPIGRGDMNETPR